MSLVSSNTVPSIALMISGILFGLPFSSWIRVQIFVSLCPEISPFVRSRSQSSAAVQSLALAASQTVQTLASWAIFEASLYKLPSAVDRKFTRVSVSD